MPDSGERMETMETKETRKRKTTKRAYKGEHMVDHDLFKLLPAETLKNVSWNPDIPRYEPVMHCHFFHTVDSSGEAQKTSTPIAGHFHEVMVTRSDDGVPHVEISGPKTYVMRKTARGMEKVAVSIEVDNHVHEVEYLSSERITVRQMNTEFLKYQSAVESNQVTSIPGVKG